MGRLSNIQRFPHTCEIYTMTNFSPFSGGEKSVLWSGRCRKELMSANQGHEFVIKADYRISLGALVGGSLSGDANAAYDGKRGQECGAVVSGIVAGMKIDVTDRQGTFTLEIKDAYAGELGTSVFADMAAN